MRYFGIDVHLEFCEIAFVEGDRIFQFGQIASSPEAIGEFARGLGPEDQVVLDACASTMAIARILRESEVDRVVLSDAAQTRAISHARVKSDRFDAAMLARLLASGMLSEVWLPDEATLALRRRVARRAALVRARTRAKNQAHGVAMRCLLGRPPVSDLFGRKGRRWLSEQALPEEEAETVGGCLRQIDFLSGEIAQLDQKIAEQALAWPGLHRLLSIPGVDIGTAAAVLAAVGDISRFHSSAQLVAYLGLDPKVRQSGSEAPRYGHISKRGNAQARSMLVEAAWIAIRSPGPLRPSASACVPGAARRSPLLRSRASSWFSAGSCSQRTRTTPSRDPRWCARRPAALNWPPERRAGHAATTEPPSAQAPLSAAERELQAQAELAYRRLIADWQAAAPKDGAGATPGRASNRPSRGKAARQAQSP